MKLQHKRKYCLLVGRKVFLALGTFVDLLLLELHSTVFLRRHLWRVRFRSLPIMNMCWTDDVISHVRNSFLYLCKVIV